MALRINHNIASLDAWRNLTNTTRAMGVTMEKLSSGYRVNRAADDPAGLVISEQFRAQIAGLNRAIQNSEGSINMIQTAEGALNEINNLLVSMRELAIHAANEGFNDTNQLAADQAEITNAIATITRIAQTTQFGTKKLINGSNSNTTGITSSNDSLLNLTGSQLGEGVHSITANMTSDSTATIDNEIYGLSNVQNPYNLSDGVHEIDVVQGSASPDKMGAPVNVRDHWGNGVTFHTGTASDWINARVFASVDTTAVTASAAATFTFQIDFQEHGKNHVGLQTLTFYVDNWGTVGDIVANVASALNNAIAANDYLAGKVLATVNVNDEAAQAFTLALRAVNAGAGFSIATGDISIESADDTTGTLLNEILNPTGGGQIDNNSARGVSDGVFDFTLTFGSNVDTETATADIDLANDLTAAAVTFNTMSELVTALNASLGLQIASGGFGSYDPSVFTAQQRLMATVVEAGGQEILKFYSRDEGSRYSLKLNSVTSTNNVRGYDVLGLTVDQTANRGLDAIIRFDDHTNYINDVRFHHYTTYDDQIALYNSADTATRGSVNLDVAQAYEGGIDLGNMLLSVDARAYAIQLDGGLATTVKAGVSTRVFNSDRTESIYVTYGLTSNGGTESLYTTDRSLVFQIGANYGQTTKIGLDDLSADNIGRGLTNSMWTNLAEVDVTTAQGAQDAMKVIDKAIDDVTNIRGLLGSFQKNTLESNLTNLRIASQNLTASESSIRDTDMAKEMSVYVKHQILLQAGTAMLAQGNQIPQVVLSLFG
jgi:flagellin